MPKRGPKISPKIRELIILRALDEPRIPRDAVAIHLVDEIERMGLTPPSEDTIMKMISRTRNHEPNPLDNPWSIGSSIRYDFSPDIIPVLIEVQKLQMQSEYEAAKERLTIRQAQWIARLYPLVTEIYVRKYSVDLDEFKKPVNKEYLWMVHVISAMYAQKQKMSEIIGIEYQDTTEYDEKFFITELFWELSASDRANITIASRTLYNAVRKEWGDGRVKQRRIDNSFQGAES